MQPLGNGDFPRDFASLVSQIIFQRNVAQLCSYLVIWQPAAAVAEPATSRVV